MLAALLQAGHRPLLPFGDGHPYDIALDDGGKLKRVQCKTGRLVRGAVVFPTSIWCRDNNYRAYREDIDFFGVYCPGTGEVYLVPIEDVPERGAHLRIEPTRNNQATGVLGPGLRPEPRLIASGTFSVTHGPWPWSVTTSH